MSSLKTFLTVLCTLPAALLLGEHQPRFSLHLNQATLIETFQQSDGLQDELSSRLRVITSLHARWVLKPDWQLTCALSQQIFNPISQEGSSMVLSGLNFKELHLAYRPNAQSGFSVQVGRQNLSLAEGLLFADGSPFTQGYLKAFDALRIRFTPSSRPFQIQAVLYSQGRMEPLPELFSDRSTLFSLQDAHGALLGLSWLPGSLKGQKQFSLLLGTHVASDHPQAPLEARISWLDLSWQWPLFSARTLFRGEMVYQNGTLGQKNLQAYALTLNLSRDFSPFIVSRLSFSTTLFSGDRTSTSRHEGFFPLYGDSRRFGPWAPYLLTPEDRFGQFSNLLVLTARADIHFLDGLNHELSVNWARSPERDALMNAFGLQGRERGVWVGLRNQFRITDSMWAHFTWEHLFPGSYYLNISDNCNWISAGFFWTLSPGGNP